MCLKYFVRHAACEHHEYLGSQHCSSTPCDLSKQHFHYLVDNYPIPRPSDLQHGVLTCTTCVNERGDGLDPEKLPVKYYDPTNNYQVKEIKPTGYKLPIRVVKVETEDVQAEAAKAEGSETAEAEASETSEADEDDNGYGYDYKSLSSADEDEWELRDPGHDTRTHIVQGEPIALSNRVPFQGQPNTLPTDLGYWQDAPFVSSYWPAMHAMEIWTYHTVPYMEPVAPSNTICPPGWYGGMPPLFPVPMMAVPARLGGLSLQHTLVPAPSYGGILAAPAAPTVLQQRPATPPRTPLTHITPPCPTPPSVVGTLTDAFPRVQTAHEHRYARWCAHRAKTGVRPPRGMELVDLVVNRRSRRRQHRGGGQFWG